MAATLQELAARVHAWIQTPHAHGHTNAGIVAGDDGVTIIDTLLVPSQAALLAEQLEALGLPVRHAVYTSSHIEYVGGSSVFWMAARYGRRQTSALLDQPPNLAGYRLMYPEFADEFDDEFATRPVSHVIEEPAWLTPEVLAIPVSGQQLENVVVQVPSVGVVFAGAMCTFGVTPNCFDGDPEAWGDALAELATWANAIVPGIGPVGGPDDVLALQAYLYACVEAEGDPGAIPPGPWDAWTDRELDTVNVERAAMLAEGNREVPPSMLARLGLA